MGHPAAILFAIRGARRANPEVVFPSAVFFDSIAAVLSEPAASLIPAKPTPDQWVRGYAYTRMGETGPKWADLPLPWCSHLGEI
jgi:hypothetical protein